MANPYIRRSLALLRAEGDQTGAAMASLARVRYERLAEKQTHRMSVIREVARLAERLNDLPLLAQAYTAFGDEFMSADQRLEARLYYLKTLEALEHSDAPALGVWARRGLLRAAEMSL